MSEEDSVDLTPFRKACEVVDHDHDTIVAKANGLACPNQLDTAANCFRFVRDEIRHSGDFQLNPVTCKASDVLAHGTGYCYAKSHLLCALLRSNDIPAGFCYQRLSVDGHGAPFCLHGMTAIWISELGWYRVDPRGNRAGIDAQFNPPHEQLAFSTSLPGERDLAGIHPNPLDRVVEALSQFETWDALGKNLPDSVAD